MALHLFLEIRHKTTCAKKLLKLQSQPLKCWKMQKHGTIVADVWFDL